MKRAYYWDGHLLYVMSPETYARKKIRLKRKRRSRSVIRRFGYRMPYE